MTVRVGILVAAVGAALAALPAAASAAMPASTALTSTLDDPRPHVAVDDGGTAYVTWNAGPVGPGGEGGIGFCRLPRGATACANPPESRLIVPSKTYGEGDDPSYNQDAGTGAYPVVLGDQLFVLSTRGPTTYATPAGDSTATTIAFASTNAGDSWSGGLPVAGDLRLTTRPVAFGSDDNPLIGLLGGSSGDAVAFAAVAGGLYTPGAFRLGQTAPGIDGSEAPDALTALPGGGVAAAYATLNGSLTAGGAVRRDASSAVPTSAAAFTAPASFPGSPDQGRATLAYGPGGLLLGTIGGAAKKLNQRAVVTPLDGGAPIALTDSTTVDLQLVTGGAVAGGPVVASYQLAGDPAAKNGLYVRRAANGKTFTAAQRLTPGSRGVHGDDLAAAPDGGGFAVFQTDSSSGEVRVVPFGPQGATGRPGLPGSTPGAGAAGSPAGVTKDCDRIAVGALQVTTADGVGCFVPGTGANKGRSISNGAVLFNGLRITPLSGQVILEVDSADQTLKLQTTGPVKVEIPSAVAGDTLLFQGALPTQTLTAKEGQPFLDLPAHPVTIKGFRVASRLAPLAAAGGARIPVDLDLGPQFLGLTAHADLIVSPTEGLVLDSLHLHQDTLPLGPVVVRDLDVTWTREGNLWTGGAKIDIPGGAQLTVDASFDSTSFTANASYEMTPPGVSLFAPPPLVWWHEIHAGVAVNRNGKPLVVEGGVKIGAFFVAPHVYGLDVDGTVALTFADPFVIRVGGTLEILSTLQIADSWIQADSNGFVRGHTALDLGIKDVASLGLSADLAMGPPGFEFDGQANACVGIKLVSYCVDAAAHGSNKGVAGCTPEILGRRYTLAYQWGKGVSRYKSKTCFFAPVSIGLLRSAPDAQARAVEAPAGAESLSINVATADGVPAVDVLGPNGAPVDLGAATVSADGSAVTHTLAIDIDAPAPGRYEVVARPGSPGLTAVTAGVPAAAPKLTARVGRPRRGTRTITYAVTRNPDVTVSFSERTRLGTVPLAGTPGRKGTVRFRPAAAASGKHVVVAQLLDADGIPVTSQTVGTFDQPAPPAMRAPRRVKVTHLGGRLKVTVQRAGARTPLLVTARYGAGGVTSAIIPAGKASAIIAGPAKGPKRIRPTVVGVQAVNAAGRRSAARRVRVR
jgi:hypothetical protein